MTHRPTRRGFMAASAATAAIFAMPRRNMAQSAALTLRATTRTLDVNGRAATVFGVTDGAGSPGLTLQPGQRFRLDLKNDLAEPTIIHWHGQILPNAQDGVPDLPMPPLQPGETRSYDYQPAAGTHWMHSHIPLQEMRQLAAPLIVLRPEDLRADRQEVVMFLHDFSFRSPEEVLAEIGSGKGHGEAEGMADGAMNAQGGGHDMAAMGAPTGTACRWRACRWI